MALRDPPVVPALRVNVTVPVGTFDPVVVSATVAVQVEVRPTFIESGRHDTEVEVLSFTTVTVPETVLELVL